MGELGKLRFRYNIDVPERHADTLFEVPVDEICKNRTSKLWIGHVYPQDLSGTDAFKVKCNQLNEITLSVSYTNDTDIILVGIRGVFAYDTKHIILYKDLIKCFKGNDEEEKNKYRNALIDLFHKEMKSCLMNHSYTMRIRTGSKTPEHEIEMLVHSMFLNDDKIDEWHENCSFFSDLLFNYELEKHRYGSLKALDKKVRDIIGEEDPFLNIRKLKDLEERIHRTLPGESD